MWELDYKESWVLKNWCFWTVVLEKTLESPLDCKEIQPIHPKEDQSWVYTGRTDVEADAPILWPPDAKSWLIWKDPDAGKDWGQEEKGKRGWDGWMASPTQWTWVWVNSRSWWWTGRPGVLQFMWSQRVRHDWATELNWIELNWMSIFFIFKEVSYFLLQTVCVLYPFFYWAFDIFVIDLLKHFIHKKTLSRCWYFYTSQRTENTT